MKLALVIIVCVGLYTVRAAPPKRKPTLNGKYNDFLGKIDILKLIIKHAEEDIYKTREDLKNESQDFKRRCIASFDKRCETMKIKCLGIDKLIKKIAFDVLDEQMGFSKYKQGWLENLESVSDNLTLRSNLMPPGSNQDTARIKRQYRRFLELAQIHAQNPGVDQKYNLPENLMHKLERANEDFKKECIDTFEEECRPIKEIRGEEIEVECRSAYFVLTGQITIYIDGLKKLDKNLAEFLIEIKSDSDFIEFIEKYLFVAKEHQKEIEERGPAESSAALTHGRIFWPKKLVHWACGEHYFDYRS